MASSSSNFGTSLPSSGVSKINLFTTNDATYNRAQNNYLLPTPQNNSQTSTIGLLTETQTWSGDNTFTGATVVSAINASTISTGVLIASSAVETPTITNSGGTVSIPTSGTVSIPAATDTLVNLASVQTLSKKVYQFNGPALVTQSTNITTTVDLSAVTSSFVRLLTQTASTAAGATTSFTLTLPTGWNSSVTFTKNTFAFLVSLMDYSGTLFTDGLPFVTCSSVGAGGSATIRINNIHSANALNGALVLGIQLVGS